MQTVEVQVVLWYLGRERAAVVEVPRSAFVQRCWKTIANLAAAVEMGVPFVEFEGKARYGLRPADKRQLLELCRDSAGDAD